MNKENIRKLIRHLQKTPAETFDMREWITGKQIVYPLQISIDYEPKILMKCRTDPCGTTACIAGHAAICFADKWQEFREYIFTTNDFPRSHFTVPEFARWALGLDEGDAFLLFHGHGRHHRAIVKKTHAIITLKNMLKTGKVKWLV